MAYEAEKDVAVAAFPALEVGPDNRLEFDIVRYDGGPPKLRISRVRKFAADEKRGAPGRFSHDELALLIHRLKEILPNTAWGPPDGPF